MNAVNSKIKFITRFIFVFYLFVFAAGGGQNKFEKTIEKEIKSLIQNLTFKSPLFDKSRERLVGIGPPALEYLIQALKDENEKVRHAANEALKEIEFKKIIENMKKGG